MKIRKKGMKDGVSVGSYTYKVTSNGSMPSLVQLSASMAAGWIEASHR